MWIRGKVQKITYLGHFPKLGKIISKNLNISVDKRGFLYYTTKGIEAWLSLVERCVRDAEAACSNHVASRFT